VGRRVTWFVCLVLVAGVCFGIMLGVHARKATRPCYVYIYRNKKTGRPVRIGIAFDVQARRGGYLREGPWWWPLTNGVPEIEGRYRSKPIAHAREVALIRMHRPVGNVQHNPDRRQYRASLARDMAVDDLFHRGQVHRARVASARTD
jgi:hypothetical protein